MDSLDEILSTEYARYKARIRRVSGAIPEEEWRTSELPQCINSHRRRLGQSNLDSDPDPDQGPDCHPPQQLEDRPQTNTGGRAPKDMAGFGQAPVFGAQALSTDATNPSVSPFGAPSNSSSPFGQPQHQAPIFGAPVGTTNHSFQQAQSSSPFGFPNNPTNGPIGNSSGGPAFGSSDQTNGGAMNSNPFAAAPAAPAGMAANPFANASANPFGNAPPTTNQSSIPGANPFASAGSSNPFGTSSSPANGASNAFANPAENSSNQVATPFASATANHQKRKNGFEGMGNSKRLAFDSTSNAFLGSNAPFSDNAASNGSSGFGVKDMRKNRNGFAEYLEGQGNNGLASVVAPTHTAGGKGGKRKSPSLYAKEIRDQLRKDNIKPPAWPKQPGNPTNRRPMEEHREKYKKHEGRVRTSLIKAGLIDDPDVRKKLSDAIDFRGICEDMCPEGEKVSRIVEYDVKAAEKTASPDGLEMWPEPARMVKTFKRSAAGTDSPLPTEVRSPAALKRTVEYLIDDLLKSDENLPTLHNFLWDRTRAIRKDFIFQNAMSAEERTDQIYCLENIARFHAVALHLLSQEDFAAEDFSEQQEREQLGKTLLSLMQVYDECKDMEGVRMENEAEFRAYYLLFNAHDPFVKQQLQDWNDKFWFNSTEIQTVVTLIEAMQNVWSGRGPLRPQVPLTTGSPSFTTYFSIVEDPRVSYTMACFAEIHFTEIRRHLLKSIHKAYGRVRDGPKDLTAKVLNEMFRFDTEDQCVSFLEELGMEFSSAGAGEPYLVVERRKSLPGKTIRQSFSGMIVEPKRGDHSLPEVIHTTVFQDASSTASFQSQSPDSMFVTQPPEMPVNGAQKQFEVNFSDEESPSASPAPPKAFSPFQNPPLSNGFGSANTNKSVLGSTPANPFASAQPIPNNAPVVDKPSSNTQAPPFSWAPNPPSNVFAEPAPSQSGSQAPTQMPKFSWSVTPATSADTSGNTTSSSSGAGGVFDFLHKPAEKPNTSFFPTTASSTSTAGISQIDSVNDQNKAPGLDNQASNHQPTTSAGTVPPVSQNGPSASTSVFFNPPAVSGSTATSPFFKTSQPRSTTPPTQQLEMAPPSTPPGYPKFQTVKTPTPAPRTPAPPRDLMGDLTQWVVLGDKGLMDEFQEALVAHLVRNVFEQHHKDEEDRKRKEEQEKSWAKADKFRRYSLRVRYFYRWRQNVRKSALRRVGRNNRAAMRAYREEKLAEARAAKASAEKEEQARVKRLKESSSSSWLEELEKDRAMKRARMGSMSLNTSRRSSFASTTRDALVSTGVFSGLQNEREMAAGCVGDDDSLYDHLVGVSIHPNPSQTSMGPPARPKDPLRSVRNAAVAKPAPKPKLSKKAQYLQDLLNGKHKEDDLISFKSSTSSRLGQSVHGGKVTNFSRYQSSSPRSSVEPDRPKNGPGSGIKSSYWLLRSRGLFATPTGHVLSDKAPRPTSNAMYEGGSQYSGDSEAGDFDDRVLEQDSAYRASLGLTGARRSTFSVRSEAASPPRDSFLKPKQPAAFRQSMPAGASAASLLSDRQMDGDAASQVSMEGSHISTIQQDVEESLRELRKVAAELDGETDWYREQNKQLSKG